VGRIHGALGLTVLPPIPAFDTWTMLKFCRWNILLCLLATQATTSLCGPGHHAFDDILASSTVQSPGAGDVVCALDADDSCPLCDFLSLSAPLPDLATASIWQVVAVCPAPIESIRLPGPIPNASSPRAPPHLTV
jgi:hypothetical protein